MLSLAWEPKLFADAELNTSEHLFWLTTNYDVKLQAASQSPNNIILKNDFLHTDLKLAEYKRWFLMEKMHPKNSETQQELLVLDQKIEELKKQYEDLIKSFYLLPDQDQALLISDAKKVKAQMKKEYVEDEIIKKNQLILKAIQERSLTMYFNNNLIEVVMCA
ncbi:MAG: hypothetical protein HYW85_04825 [Deltaproteobacteria bacterium]|nr:hypothetical protein [Deltaproteobacteria bacterium]